jgi:hypothetical protein
LFNPFQHLPNSQHTPPDHSPKKSTRFPPAQAEASTPHSTLTVDSVLKDIQSREPNPGSERDELIIRVIDKLGDDLIASTSDALKLIRSIRYQDSRTRALNALVTKRGPEIITSSDDACQLLQLVQYQSDRASLVPKFLRLEGIGDTKGVHAVCSLLQYQSDRFDALSNVIDKRGRSVIHSADDACKLIRLLQYQSDRASIVSKVLGLEAIGGAHGVHEVCSLLQYQSDRFDELSNVIRKRGGSVIQSADDALKLLRLLQYDSDKSVLLGQILKVGTLNDSDKKLLQSKFREPAADYPPDRPTATTTPYLLAHINRFNHLVKIGQEHGLENLTPLALSQGPIDKEALRRTYRQLAKLFHPDTAPDVIRGKYDLTSHSQGLTETYDFLKENLPNAQNGSPGEVRFTEVDATNVTACSFIYSDRDRMEAIAEIGALAKKSAWTLSDLSSAFKGSLVMGHPLPTVPQSIDFEPMRNTIVGLSQLTAGDNRERGKSVFIDIKTKQLIVGTTTLGDGESVTIKSTVPSQYADNISAKVLFIHTHPATLRNKDAMLHFSAQDLESFMQSNVFGSLVIARDKALFVLKSSESKDYDPTWGSIHRWWQQGTSATSQEYTQRACRSLGATLYLLDFGTEDWVARQVSLDQRAHKTYRLKDF